MSEWTCPKCRAPMAAGSRFCPNCGQPIASVPSATQPRNVWPWVIAFVGLMALVLGGLVGSGLLRIGAQSGPPQLQVKGEAPPPQLQAKAVKPPEIKMPDDVYQWLKHLEETERRFAILTRKQYGQVLGLGANVQVAGLKQMLQDLGSGSGSGVAPVEGAPEPGQVEQKIVSLRPEWTELTTFFRSLEPPQECQEVATNYDSAMIAAQETYEFLTTQMQAAAADPEAGGQLLPSLTARMNSSKETIDQPRERADQGVGSICDRYQARKWFVIPPDPIGGHQGMLGLGVTP